MRNTIIRFALGAAALAGAGVFVSSPVEAAQAWSCICDGTRKRYLASTRHCEFKNNLPKGRSCNVAQWRSVYGPACRKNGCVLPPLR